MHCIVGGDVSLPWTIGLRQAAPLVLDGVQYSRTRDTRQGILQVSTRVTGGTLALADPGVPIASGGLLGRTNFLIPLNYVLAPGDALIAHCSDANVLFKVSWLFYERVVEPSELR